MPLLFVLKSVVSNVLVGNFKFRNITVAATFDMYRLNPRPVVWAAQLNGLGEFSLPLTTSDQRSASSRVDSGRLRLSIETQKQL